MKILVKSSLTFVSKNQQNSGTTDTTTDTNNHNISSSSGLNISSQMNNQTFLLDDSELQDSELQDSELQDLNYKFIA